jgi:hypothetical protein
MNTKKAIAILISLVMTLALSLSLALAAKDFTVGGNSDGNNGLRTEGDAAGIKLIGPVFVVYPDYPADETYCDGAKCAASAQVSLRLRKGNDLQVFYTELEGPLYPESAPADVQNAIAYALSTEVLTYFFNGESVSPTLKSAEEFISDLFCEVYAGPICVSGTLVTSADLTIAVK